MKLALTLILVCTPALAQMSGSTARRIVYGASLPAACKPSTGDIFFKTSATVGPYYCSATNTWSPMSGSGPTGVLGPATTTNDENCIPVWSSTNLTLKLTTVKWCIDPATGALSSSSTDPTRQTFIDGTDPSAPATGMTTIYTKNAAPWFRANGDSATQLLSTAGPAPGASTLGGVKAKTCSAGDFVSDVQTDGDVICSTPSSTSLDCTDPANICIFEDFPNENGNNGTGTYAWGVGGAAYAQRDGEAGHPWIVRGTSGTSDNDQFTISLNANNRPVILSYPFTLTCIARIPRTTSIGVECGLTNDFFFSLNTGYKVILRYDTDRSDTTYKYLVCNNGTCASADSTAAPSTAFRRMTCSGTSSVITCSLYDENGAAISGSTKTFCTAGSGCDTNSVTFPTVAMSPFLGTVTRVAASAATIDIDFWSYKATTVSR